jgi:hypothetical protein
MTLWKAVLAVVVCHGATYAQLSTSAYRVLGQPDLRQNGLNLVQGVELRQPSGIALDARGNQTHIYIADTLNSRVLGWADVASYQIGDAPDVVLGQLGPQYSGLMGSASRIQRAAGAVGRPAHWEFIRGGSQQQPGGSISVSFCEPDPDRTRCGLWAAKFHGAYSVRCFEQFAEPASSGSLRFVGQSMGCGQRQHEPRPTI